MELPKLRFFWEYPEYWAEKDPEFPSIRFGKRTITVKELNEKTDQLAKAFLDMGVKKGDRVVTVLPTIPEFIFTLIAASKIGAITVPMDVNYKRADFQRLIPHSEPKVVITVKKFGENRIADTLQELSPQFGDVQYVLVEKSDFGTPFEDLMKKEYDLGDELRAAKESQDENDAILIVWTGGTTGAPKAVILSHKNVVTMCYVEYENLTELLATKGVTGRLKSLVNLPVSHVGGTVELIGTGIVGGFEMFVQDHWSPWPSLTAIKKNSIPWMGGVPTMFKIFLSLPDLDDYKPKRHLKLVILSGEKVSLGLLEGIRDRICDTIVIGYGSTEAGAEVTFTDPEDALKKIAGGYVGKALPDMEIVIADEEGNRLPPGKVGEILVRGPLTSRGYFKMPKEDEAGFSPDGYCKTGDLGYLDEDGGLYITGRLKEIIRVGSYTVLPAEIEEIVLKHPKVAIAAALGAPDEKYGEVVWLVVGPELGQTVDEEEILEMCKKELAQYKVPKKIIIYNLDPADLPVTRVGKVDRVRLKKELLPPSE